MGGRKIADRHTWVGSEVVPMHSKVKEFGHGDHAGELSVYQDTEEKMVSQQAKTVSKLKSHSVKESYRN